MGCQHKDGFEFRRILPRALAIMGDAVKQDKLRDSIADVLSAATSATLGQASADGGSRTQAESTESTQAKIESLLEQILSGDQHSAQQNVTRLRTCSKYFQSASIPNIINTTSAWMDPIEYCVNRLFHRSALLFQFERELKPSIRRKHEQEFLLYV